MDAQRAIFQPAEAITLNDADTLINRSVTLCQPRPARLLPSLCIISNCIVVVIVVRSRCVALAVCVLYVWPIM
jgi:hypothetical protein